MILKGKTLKIVELKSGHLDNKCPFHFIGKQLTLAKNEELQAQKSEGGADK